MAVTTKKFSEFADGGDLTKDNTTVGVESGTNTRFNNPWPFLPPGTTAQRPVPSPEIDFRLRFNIDTEEYEYFSPTLNDWIVIEDSLNLLPILASHLPGEGASLIGLEDQGTVLDKTVQDLANSTLIAQTNNGSLVDGQFLSVLPNGFTSVTTATGVLSSRQFQGTVNQIDITNADGAGDPAWAISATLDTPGTFTIQGTAVLNAILDEDDMISNSPNAGVTQQSVKAYVDSSVFGFSWTEVVSVFEMMLPDRGYVANNALQVVLVLPVTASIGDRIMVQGKGAGGWRISQNAGQIIHFGSSDTTLGVGGFILSTHQYDSVQLVCITTDTDWAVLTGPMGTLTVN